MFRHQGIARTLNHNLSIASLLSFVAGNVNVVGFLAVNSLTTNVTGHFAFLIDEIFKLRFWSAFIYFLYIFSFFMGAFFSGLLVEIMLRKNESSIFIVPILAEILILFLIMIFGKSLLIENPKIIACGLLFAMGLQNSLVTKISNATVRTTHLTGLFTDLGIEISQLFYYKRPDLKVKLYSLIKLRFTIIGFFFFGGIVSGILYEKFQLRVLIIAILVLTMGVIYDYIKLKVILLKRKILR